MRQQTKPFIVEIKQSRKLKTADRNNSIWGKLNLKLGAEPVDPLQMEPMLAADDDVLARGPQRAD